MEKQKEYNLRYLLAKVHTARGKASDRLLQRANKRNKNHVGRHPTSDQKRKIILSDEVRRMIGKVYNCSLRTGNRTGVAKRSFTVCCDQEARKDGDGD
jgi:hypothetical protein